MRVKVHGEQRILQTANILFDEGVIHMSHSVVEEAATGALASHNGTRLVVELMRRSNHMGLKVHGDGG